MATLLNLSLVVGVRTISSDDGDANVRVAFAAPEIFFVVVEITADAESQSPSKFAVAHAAELSSSGEDIDHDIPLILEFAGDVGTGTIDTALSSASCQAPFELELSERTVSTTLVCEAGTVLRAGTAFTVVSPGGA